MPFSIFPSRFLFIASLKRLFRVIFSFVYGGLPPYLLHMGRLKLPIWTFTSGMIEPTLDISILSPSANAFRHCLNIFSEEIRHDLVENVCMSLTERQEGNIYHSYVSYTLSFLQTLYSCYFIAIHGVI